MIDTIKKTLAAAEELGQITDMDVLDFGNDRKTVFIEGHTHEGLPFELDLKVGIRKEETNEE